jgi:hypothetical protein
MEAILLLLFGYAISKALTSDGNKKRHHPRRRPTTFWDCPTYSEYDTWRKSHGDRNRLS